MIGAILALTVGAGSMQATNLLSASATTLTTPTASVTCSTLTGPGASQSLVIHASGAPTGFSIVVGVIQTPGVKVTAPAAVILNTTTNTAGLTFTVSAAPGCANSTTGNANSFSVQFTSSLNNASAVNDVSATITDTVANTTASALVASGVSLTCGYNATGPVYVPGSPKIVSVTSAANLGTPFTVNNSGLPSWLVLGPTAPYGTAGTNAANFTVAAAPGTSSANGCGTFAGITQTFTLHLVNAPAADQTIVITLTSATLSPLTITQVPAAPTISMQYTKTSGNPGVANASVTSSLANAYFIVNQSTVPGWLTVNPGLGTVPANGKAMQFGTTTEADSLAPGNYTTTIFLQVAGYADAPVSISLLVTNKPPKLSVITANPMAVTYTLGSASTPVSTITVASSDSPIPYTVTLGGALQPTLAAGQQLTGIAYSFGSTLTINYNASVFATSSPGTIISGTVTFSYGAAPVSVLVVTINLTVGSPAATITSISPATLPTSAPNSVYHVTVLGSGFVTSTVVGLVTGTPPGSVGTNVNFHTTYNNPGNLDLQITVPPLTDTSLPFALSGAGGPVYLGVSTGSSNTTTGAATLTVSPGPIIYGVTSSSSFNEVSGGNLPQLAPYDMVSIFGSSFCASGGSGCSSTQILSGTPDPVYHVFPFALSPDTLPATGPDTRRQLSVMFYPHGTLANGLPAPLLFATNGQINTVVPGAVLAAPTIYDVVVSFGCPLCSPSTVVSSAPFPVNTVATDPGIFTVGSDGQGAAAALAAGTYALINSANPAGMRSGVGNSDTIQLYVTGLGLPGTGVAFGAGAGCVSTLGTGYLAALNASTNPAAAFTTIDGAALMTTLFPNEYPPCLTTEPTVTVGGVPTSAVTYSAFVGNTIAGLYQINVQLPSTYLLNSPLQPEFPSSTGEFTHLLTPTQLPIYVSIGGQTTQAGVMLSVAPRLAVTPPAGTGALTVGQPYTGNVTATLGTSPYTYALTSGVLPAGLTLTTAGNLGVLAGLPAENTGGSYNVTVTATDSAAAPLTGSVSFTITVAGGLYVITTVTGTANPGPFSASVFGQAGASLPTAVATGGNGTYTYAITTPASLPTGMSIGSGLLATTSSTPAGDYQIVVTATDGLGATGYVTFNDLIALSAIPGSVNNTTVAGGGLVTTIPILGASGPVTCTTSVPSKFTCIVSTSGSGPYTNSVALNATANALTLNVANSVTVTVTDTVTAPGAQNGTYGTGTTTIITDTPAS
jgi:hypothetical protein